MHVTGRATVEALAYSIPVSNMLFVVVFRKSSSVNMGSSAVKSKQESDVKRIKTDGQDLVDKTTKSTGKMIELDLVSSDEDF